MHKITKLFLFLGIAGLVFVAQAMQNNTTEEVLAECYICFEPLDQLKTTTIVCGHSFCSECIQGWYRKATPATCPVCRRRFSIKAESCCANLQQICVAFLRKNFCMR